MGKLEGTWLHATNKLTLALVNNVALEGSAEGGPNPTGPEYHKNRTVTYLNVTAHNVRTTYIV